MWRHVEKRNKKALRLELSLYATRGVVDASVTILLSVRKQHRSGRLSHSLRLHTRRGERLCSSLRELRWRRSLRRWSLSRSGHQSGSLRLRLRLLRGRYLPIQLSDVLLGDALHIEVHLMPGLMLGPGERETGVRQLGPNRRRRDLPRRAILPVVDQRPPLKVLPRRLAVRARVLVGDGEA